MKKKQNPNADSIPNTHSHNLYSFILCLFQAQSLRDGLEFTLDQGVKLIFTAGHIVVSPEGHYDSEKRTYPILLLLELH